VAEAGGRRHWTVALWPVASAAALAEGIEQHGLRRLEEGLGTVGWHSVVFPAAEAFANINNEQDLEYVSHLLGNI
jgi:molybdopterin-guanine dinucleotide biosynthesis protein A